MKKIIALGLALALACVGLAACGAQEQTLTTVRLNEVAHSVFYAPLYAAESLGYFADEGIALELTNGGGADKVMTAVLAGQADVGLAGPESCIYVLLEGREDHPVVFAQLTKRDGSFLVGREDVTFDWELLRGRHILGGRKGGVPEMTLEHVMRLNGVDPQADAFVDTSVQFNMMAGAFTGGTGDFVTLFEPTATEVELAGQGYVLTSIGQESGEIPYTAFFAAKSFIAAHPALIEGFTRAVARGQKWVQEAEAEKVAQAIAGQFPDADVAVLTKVVERYRAIDAWNKTPVMTHSALENLETVMEEAGELSRRVDFAALVDNSFAEKAGK